VRAVSTHLSADDAGIVERGLGLQLIHGHDGTWAVGVHNVAGREILIVISPKSVQAIVANLEPGRGDVSDTAIGIRAEAALDAERSGDSIVEYVVP